MKLREKGWLKRRAKGEAAENACSNSVLGSAVTPESPSSQKPFLTCDPSADTNSRCIFKMKLRVYVNDLQ